MGRFRMADEDDDPFGGHNNNDNHNNNYFQSNHVYSSSEDEDGENELGGFWRGALVPMTRQRPQLSQIEIDRPEDFQYQHHEMSHAPNHPPFISFPQQQSSMPNDDDDDISAIPDGGLLQQPENDEQDDVDDGDMQPYQQDDRALLVPQQSQSTPPPKSSSSVWFWFIMVSIVGHFLSRYGPAAPPPEAESHSWREFWVRELEGLTRSAVLIGWTVPQYTAHWVVGSVGSDLQAWWHEFQTYYEEQAKLQYWAECALTIPPDEWNLEVSSSSHLSTIPMNYEFIVGQSWAVETTTKALDAWTQSAPLLLYFAGSRGVGKLELARQVSLRMFGQCLDLDNIDNSFEDLTQKKAGPVMLLQGRDFAATAMTTKTIHQTIDSPQKDKTSNGSHQEVVQTASQQARAIRVQLYESLIRHARLHPNGTVVVLQHVEDMAHRLMATLVQDLTFPSRRGTTAADALDDDLSLQHSLASRLQQACEKTVFIMTSEIGSKTIAQSIHRFGGLDNIQQLELDLTLMHEIDMELTVTGTAGMDGKRMPTMEVGSKFHALAPFFPLEQPTLSQMLALKIHQWSLQQQQKHPQSAFPTTLRVTKLLLDTLLDKSRVEYLTVMNKKTTTTETRTPLLTFSSVGGHFLREGTSMMNSWQGSVKRCFRNNQKAAESMERTDDDGDTSREKQENDKTPKDERVINVLDFETWSRKAIVLVCPEGAASHDVLSNPVIIVDRAACEEICRFTLQYS